MKKINRLDSNSIISNAIFGITVTLIIINLISVVLPAFITRLASPYQSNINPYEFGVAAFPVLAGNLILLAIAILYQQKMLPAIATKSINFILNFEVPRKIAFISMISLLVIFIAITIGDIPHSKEETWGDYNDNKAAVSQFHFNKFTTLFVRYSLLSISQNVLGNIRIIPYIASISLLILTYFTTVVLSGKRFAGIVAVIILVQSNLFLFYSTSSTYENFWTLFYLLSLYLIYKKWYLLSPVSFILSVFSKQLTVTFLPLTFFFIYRSAISRKKKIITASIYAVITILIVLLVSIDIVTESKIYLPSEFWTGLSELGNFLRYDLLVLIFLLPLIVALYIKSRNGMPQADSIMVIISSIFLVAAILGSITYFKNEPYRFVPLVVFFAIGAGMLFSKKLDYRPDDSP